jgi:Domain of unknown function (DUF1737)
MPYAAGPPAPHQACRVSAPGQAGNGPSAGLPGRAGPRPGRHARPPVIAVERQHRRDPDRDCLLTQSAWLPGAGQRCDPGWVPGPQRRDSGQTRTGRRLSGQEVPLACEHTHSSSASTAARPLRCGGSWPERVSVVTLERAGHRVDSADLQRGGRLEHRHDRRQLLSRHGLPMRGRFSVASICASCNGSGRGSTGPHCPTGHATSSGRRSTPVGVMPTGVDTVCDAGSTSAPPDGLPVYRVVTGPDDAAFCRRVS